MIALDEGSLCSTPKEAKLAVRKEFLNERYEEIYGPRKIVTGKNGEKKLEGAKLEFAKKVAYFRKEVYGDDKEPKNLLTAITNILNNPPNSNGKMLECVILALDGDINITWKVKRTIVEEVTETISSSSFN